MTDREKLIELTQISLNENIGKSCRLAENIADYLLANGVIVPPCKVGDKVYIIRKNKISYVKECEVVFVGISADKKCSYFNFVENYADGTFKKSYSMVFDVIGKTVFLTKEEAEKALAERSKSNERVSN